MKPVLLLYPPFEGKNYLRSRVPFPIGLLYIASFLKYKGIPALVMDFSCPPDKRHTVRPLELKTGQAGFFRFGWSDEDIEKWLGEHAKDFQNVIGVSSLMSSNYTGAYRLIDIVKRVLPNSTVILGGPHATCSPEHVMAKSKVDYVCLGEGEISFYHFLVTNSAPSIFSRSEVLQGIQRERTSFIEDMDSLPLLDRKLLIQEHSLKEVYITFSRGCPHNCSFCCNYLLQGRKWRHKSVDRCIEEIKHFRDNWGVKRFLVEDDNLCPTKIGMEHVANLCKRIITEKLNNLYYHVSHGIPVYATADPAFCELLWTAGFRGMVFPLESVNKEVLRDMNKGFTVDCWTTAISNWKWEKEFPTETIIGYPFIETIKTMLDTMLYINKHKALVWASHFRLNYGTPLFDRCLAAGYVHKDYDPINTQSFFIKTERFTIKDLQELMQIGRGLNYLVESGGSLEENPFENWAIPSKPGDIVATGKFKFNRSQTIAASILLTKTGKFHGRPFVSIENAEKLVFAGLKPSPVYKVLREMLVGSSPTTNFFARKSC